MESRMQGNLHVRFGAGDEETCPGDGARRFIPTLPADPAELSLSIGRPQPGAGGNESLECGLAPHPGMARSNGKAFWYAYAKVFAAAIARRISSDVTLARPGSRRSYAPTSKQWLPMPRELRNIGSLGDGAVPWAGMRRTIGFPDFPDALCARAPALPAERLAASRPLQPQRRYALRDLGRGAIPAHSRYGFAGLRSRSAPHRFLCEGRAADRGDAMMQVRDPHDQIVQVVH